MTNLQVITANLENLPRKFDQNVIASRVETGPLQINDDWQGIFIRGDNALHYAFLLQQLLDSIKNSEVETDVVGLMQIKNLINLLQSCRAKLYHTS